MNTQKKIRHAIIGCGGIGSFKHIKGYKGIAKDVDIVAVCDVIRETAVKLPSPPCAQENMYIVKNQWR